MISKIETSFEPLFPFEPNEKNSKTLKTQRHLSVLSFSSSKNLTNRSKASRKSSNREFSEKFKEIVSRLRFKVKIYISIQKARQNIEDHTEQTHPGYKRLVKILRNPYRSQESSQQVLEYIKHLSFFAEFIHNLGEVQDAAILELCKRLRYEYIPGGTYIFKEGDVSNDKYYVVLRGSVSIIKKIDRNVFFQHRMHTLKKIEVNENSNEKAYQEFSIDRRIAEMGSKVKEIKEGEGFGDKALVERNNKRTASVLTNVNSEFIVILKEDYLNIINRFDKRKHAKMDFMKKSIPFLDSLASLEIWDDLFYLIKELDCNKEVVLCNENKIGHNIYFIASGQCSIEKNIAIKFKKGRNESEPIEVKKTLATLGVGSCFGEELLLNKKVTKYKYSIVVKSSTASFYYIDKVQFLMRFPPDCVKLIQENFKLKEKIHQTRILEIEKDLIESEAEFHKNQVHSETNHVYKLLSPQYRTRMAQHILRERKGLNLTSPSQIKDNSSFDKIKENSYLKQIDELNQNLLNLRETVNNEKPQLKKDRSFSKKSQRNDSQREAYSSYLKQKFCSKSYLNPELESSSQEESSFSKLHSKDIDFNIGETLSPRAWMKTAVHSVRSKLNQFCFAKNPGEKAENFNLNKFEEKQNYEKKKKFHLELSNTSKSKLSKFDFGPSCFASERLKPPSYLHSVLQKKILKKMETSPNYSNDQIALENVQSNQEKQRTEGLVNLIKKLKAEKVLPLEFSNLSKIMLKKKKAKEQVKKNFIAKSLLPRSAIEKSIQERSGSPTLMKKFSIMKKLDLRIQTNFTPHETIKPINTSLQLTNMSTASRYMNSISKIEREINT